MFPTILRHTTLPGPLCYYALDLLDQVSRDDFYRLRPCKLSTNNSPRTYLQAMTIVHSIHRLEPMGSLVLMMLQVTLGAIQTTPDDDVVTRLTRSFTTSRHDLICPQALSLSLSHTHSYWLEDTITSSPNRELNVEIRTISDFPFPQALQEAW